MGLGCLHTKGWYRANWPGLQLGLGLGLESHQGFVSGVENPVDPLVTLTLTPIEPWRSTRHRLGLGLGLGLDENPGDPLATKDPPGERIRLRVSLSLWFRLTGVHLGRGLGADIDGLMKTLFGQNGWVRVWSGQSYRPGRFGYAGGVVRVVVWGLDQHQSQH